MKPLIFSFFSLSSVFLTDPRCLYRAIISSIAMGVLEGLSLFLIIPAIYALSTDTPAWGLSAYGWLVVFILSAIIAAVLGYIDTRLSYAAALDIVQNIHRSIGHQVARLPLGWFQQPIAGRLSRLVSGELMLTSEIFAHLMGPIAGKMAAIVVILVCMLAWNITLGILLAVSMLIFLVFVYLSSAIGHYAHAQAEPLEKEISDRVVEFTHCQPALRACGRSQDFAPLTAATTQWRQRKSRLLWWEFLANALTGSLTQVVVVALMTLIAQLSLDGSLSPIETIAFMGVTLRFSQLLLILAESSFGLESRRSSAEAFYEVLTAEALPEPREDAAQPTPGSVEFEHVTFSYLENTPVIKNVSFLVPPRSMVALVGPSGSGKTTVARLISRFYEVDSGAVKVGGANVKELKTRTLMSQLSMVFQEVYLFDDTLIANIRIGRPTATDDEVKEAAALAGVTEIVRRLPNGWESPVGEGGKSLSGGERQRVAIARALLKNAPIVLFDEATSALDPENEANIVAAFATLRETSTVVVIAHKLDTIMGADQIVTLNAQGEIEDIGTHEQLYARTGTYRDFWDSRAKAKGWHLA
ncbi:ABC transporter ATP-binding protein/permease [Corynebacterium sp. ES2794-CONJ1]|uniref:ABC transporter ATP-binding protein n=1 Tax=unclassified Corynebacterium TaxID=2624378 RepID=UPI00216B3F06|nr:MULTISPECIES: ABC transporter ATP-binding protein [unclassified Corynebacterium]MCS4532512.1 ABC transporter ATP-binding protein/permease [Corynebacterium sp. ES2730-CONJ]MCU9519907.1 ABC transporter ATP-binding protein/permease [Corynebacterium sp. ES2794-CONJ1]